MRPVLFEMGPVGFYSYGAMLALAFLTATFLAARSARASSMDSGKVLDLALIILISGVVGSRILYVALNWQDFSGYLPKIFFLNRGGLAIYGGFAFAIPLGVWFISRNRLPFWRTLDLVSPYIALGQAIGRIGCFLNGCCYGKPLASFPGVRFPGHLSKVHPTQIYSVMALFIAFCALKMLYRKRHFEGQVFGLYLICYSSFRFFIEMLRVNPASVFGLTVYQQISAALFVASVIMYIWRRSLCMTTPSR